MATEVDLSFSAKVIENEKNIPINESSFTKEPQVKLKRPTKTEKKRLKYEKKLEFYELKKQQKKLEKKQIEPKELKCKFDEQRSESQPKGTLRNGIYRNKRDDRLFILNSLKQVYSDETIKKNSLKICIDCSFCELMSEKEQSKLAQQIGCCYASNRAANKPAHLTLCNLKQDSYFVRELHRVNHGFERYVIEKTEQKIEEIHQDSFDRLCYLSPDSTQVLNEVNCDNVYIIGGFVDETVTKKVTLNKSNELKLDTYRLPIEEYMKRRSNEEESIRNGEKKSFNFNKILSINQILDILLKYNETNDWKQALVNSVPKRKGFFVD
jgi:tRNA (guanine9-N1)-methyltransferase